MSTPFFHFTTTATWWYISAIFYIIFALSICCILCSYAIQTFRGICCQNDKDENPTTHMNQSDKKFFYILLILTFLTIFFYFSSMVIVTVLDFITPNNMQNIHLSMMSCLIAIKLASSLYFIAKECIHLVFILRLHVIYGDTYFKYHPKLLFIFALITLLFTLALILITEFTMQSDIIYTNTPIDLINTYNKYSCDISIPDYLLICFVIFDTITSTILSYLFIKPLQTTFNQTVHDKEMREMIKNNPKHLSKLKNTIEKSVSSGATRLNKMMTRASVAARSIEHGSPITYDHTPISANDSVRFPDIDKQMHGRKSVVQSESRMSTYSDSNTHGKNDSHIFMPQQMSYMTTENLLIKKYLIISHVAIITTIMCIIVVLTSDMLGFIIIDILIHCICVVFMNKSYDKWYEKTCCGAIFMFDVFEECSNCCKRNHEMDSLKRKNVNVNYNLSDVIEEEETQNLSSM